MTCETYLLSCNALLHCVMVVRALEDTFEVLVFYLYGWMMIKCQISSISVL